MTRTRTRTETQKGKTKNSRLLLCNITKRYVEVAVWNEMREILGVFAERLM